MRATAILGCLLLLTPVGCDDKKDAAGDDKGDKDKGDKDKGGKDGGDKAGGDAAKGDEGGGAGGGGVELASQTLELSDGFKVTLDLPKGWEEQDFGGGKLLTKPDKAMFRSTLTIGTSCEGNCASIPENLKGMTAAQVEMHKGYYPTAKIVKEGEVADGGYEFHLDLAKADGTKAAQYKVVRYQEGWPSGVNCTAMMLKDDAAMIDKFKAACSAMKIVAPPAK